MMMMIACHQWSSVAIAVPVLWYVAAVLLADAVTTTLDNYLTSGCPTHCTCYFSKSPVSTSPLRTANCSDIIFSTKFHLSRQTESLVVSGSRVDLPILTAVLFRDGNQLRQLVLSRGRLHSFNGLAAPETLQSVVASHNELVSLPDATFVRLASLILLDLSHNRLEVIHRYAFSGLTLLRQLDLSRNHLSGAFEGFRWVCELRRLEVLNLSHNGIHVLDDSTFACSWNHPLPPPHRWSDDPDSTDFNVSFTHLRVLDLSFNRIRHIHNGAFIGLGRIDEIRLNDNALLGLPVHVVQLTPDVELWDLSGNEVEVIETGSFKDNHRLQELRLNRVRRLRIVDCGTFVNLTSLRRLELSQNHNLRYISRSAFVDVPALTSLVLTDSGLETLEFQVIDSLPALRELSLRGNPLTCDCTVLSLLRHVHDFNRNLSTDMHQRAVCASPAESPDATTLSSYQLSENTTTFNNDVYTDTWSTVTTDSTVKWSPTTTTSEVLLNSTETTVELSSSVQDSSTASSRCSPRILALFDHEIHATVTDILRLDCRAVGFPVPTVSWLLPVDVIDGDMSTSHGTHVTINNGTLIINAVATRYHGNYTCIADDGGNHSDRRSVYIHVKRPGTSLVLLHVTSSAVTVTWRGLHTSREYRVRYCEKRRDLNTTRSVGEVLVKPYMRSYTASRLKPETDYVFCIDVRQATFVSRFHTIHRGRFVAVHCTDITTRHQRYRQPLIRSLVIHLLSGAAAAVASLVLLVAVATFITRRYDRRKLRQAALQSTSVSSGGILLQRDDELTATTGTGSVTSFAASSVAASVTFENRAAMAGMAGDSDDCDLVAMFDSDDLDEIRTTARMQHL